MKNNFLKTITLSVAAGALLLANSPSNAQNEPGVLSTSTTPSTTDVDRSLTLEKLGVSKEKWQTLTPQEKTEYRQRYLRLKNMSNEKRKEMSERLKRFEQLPQEDKTKIRENLNRYKNASAEDKAKFRERHQRWENMSQEERQRMMERRQKLQNLEPQQKQRIETNKKRWESMPTEKRQEIRELYRERKMRNTDVTTGSTPVRSRVSVSSDRNGSARTGAVKATRTRSTNH